MPLLGKVGNSVDQLKATQGPREPSRGHCCLSFQKLVTCKDRQHSLYSHHVAPAPPAVGNKPELHVVEEDFKRVQDQHCAH